MPRPYRRIAAALTATALAAVGAVAFAPPATAAAGDLFISEYIEGSSNNKAIEIYNPSDEAVDLAASGYQILQYSNGQTTINLTVDLTGTVAAGGVFVFAHASSDPAILAQADQTTGAGLFNGDDAVALVKNGVTVDVFGQIGFDPGTEWGTGLTSTQDNTLQRKASVCVGDPNGTDAFDPSVEWDGFAQDTFTGLGAHVADCGDVEPPIATVVINEFSASTTGTDVEYIELLATPGTDLSGYMVLGIEGDAPSLGIVDNVIGVPAADASGRVLIELGSNTLENGTLSLLLITGTVPIVGTDIDTNDDGVIDDGWDITVVDAIAVNDGGAGDLTYGGVTLGVSYDGLAFAPGGASRIPDGTDTDSTSDWVRNDFDLAGIPGFTGTLVAGEAANTPGAVNSLTVPSTEPPPSEAGCELEVVTIGSVQGSGPASPVSGSTVRIEGVVVGDFQTGGFNGYYVQDAGDGDAATSDGIFVYAPGGTDVNVGDVVNIAGVVGENFGMTEIAAGDIEVCATGADLPAPTALTLPATEEQREALEGMYVTLPQSLAILEYFEFGRFGTIAVGVDRQYQPTAIFAPGSPEAIALAAQNALERITIDDGRGNQNPDPAIHPNGEEFTLENTFRGGDLVSDATGILDYRFDTWAVQPTQAAEFESVNPRPATPDVGGDLVVSSFNVLNYFTTLGSRGANDAAEFERQEAKIVAALAEIDADVFGLIEIENNGTAVATLTAALNAHLGSNVYTYLDTGVIGTDEITTALVYKPSTVAPVGDFALMDQSKDARWLDDKNRPGLTQTFQDAQGQKFTVVVNHLKSKGSDCLDVSDPDAGDGQGNCNVTRTQAAHALADWLTTDPTGQGTAGRELIIGDLNSYDKEDPIVALQTAGYTDLLAQFEGENAYSYVFDGQLGYLDHALAGADLVDEVSGAAAWLINADEPSLIDYDMSFKQPAQDALFAPDPYRSSDHDPVVVGLSLTPPDVTPPTITAVANPWYVFPPNQKDREITVHIYAADDSGDVSVEFTGATVRGSNKAEWSQTGDRTFTVKAVNGAVYSFTFTATDAAGNTATDTAFVAVGPKGLKNLAVLKLLELLERLKGMR